MRKNPKDFNQQSKLLFIVLLICCIMLTGCSTPHHEQNEAQPADTTPTVEPATQTEDRYDTSLVMLRQAMMEIPPVFAVAYFGCTDGDPLEAMLSVAPQLCNDMPFLLSIPNDNWIGTAGHLFCIVPADENATVSVNRHTWNAVTQAYEDEEVLYRSENGLPILVMCSNENGMPDTDIIITDSNGEVAFWSPHIDSSYRVASLYDDTGESLIYDYTSYEELNGHVYQGGNYLDVVGTWELTCTEVEGDWVEAAPGSCTVEITTDDNGFCWISYSDDNYPDGNFSSRELRLSHGELYAGCGNNLWFAEVCAASNEPIHYAVTLLDDETLLMQYCWEMDGIPNVSYGWYKRIY